MQRALVTAFSTAVLLMTSSHLGFAHEADSLWDKENLTGEWGGLRDHLADKGITPGFKYTGEVFTNPKGGVRRGTDYEHQLLASLDLDFEKMAGLDGTTAHLSGLSINDHGPSVRHVGNAMDVSNAEWRPQTRLWTAWLQKNTAEDVFSLRLGQLSWDDEFDVSPTAGTLLNSTFGSNASVFANLPAGVSNKDKVTTGPAYPLGAPGVRFAYQPNKNWAFLTAALSGQPASADRNGLQFHVSGGTMVLSELQYRLNQEKDAVGLPALYKIGGWYHSGQFNNIRLDKNNQSLALGGDAKQESGNWSLYGVVDRAVWRNDAGQIINLFTRVNLVPQSDRNLVTFYVDGGAGITGLLPGRGADILTLGVGYAKVSHDARVLDRENGVAVRSNETAVELAYQAAIAPWWSVTPDVQYIINPAYGGQDPIKANPTDRIPNALVFGVRTGITF